MSREEPPSGREDRSGDAPDVEDRPEREAAGPPATEPVPVPPPPPLVRRLPLGRLILGLVLVALGVIWLLEALDVVSFSFLAVLPAALILVGVILIARARTGRHSGLVVLGIVLTVILTIASGFDIKLRGGAGERTVRPASFEELEREYHLSAGELTIDLRDVTFPPGRTTSLKASVGLGQLTVRLPEKAPAELMAKAHAGAGQVTVLGRESSGLDVDLSFELPAQLATPGVAILSLDLSVGLGQIEVRGG